MSQTEQIFKDKYQEAVYEANQLRPEVLKLRDEVNRLKYLSYSVPLKEQEAAALELEVNHLRERVVELDSLVREKGLVIEQIFSSKTFKFGKFFASQLKRVLPS